MSKFKGGLILLIIFLLSAFVAFYFNDSYEKAIRKLYISFSHGKISFIHPKIYLRFASISFVLSFSLIITTLCFFIYHQSIKQRLISIILGLILFFSATLLQCYIDSMMKIIECTICNDGTRKLHYSEINYDFIFIVSLLFAILPAATIETRKLVKKSKKEKI